MKSHRLARVAEVVREVAANTILFELKDPRVKFVTVTRAEVSADLQHAKIYVSVMGTEKEQALTLHGLNSAAGFVQTRVAKQLTTRHVPHVSFQLDPGIKKAAEIARVLAAEKAAAGAVDAAAAADTDDTDGDAASADPSAPGATAADGPAGR
jgi:ribosome-binding factor A